MQKGEPSLESFAKVILLYPLNFWSYLSQSLSEWAMLEQVLKSTIEAALLEALKPLEEKINYLTKSNSNLRREITNLLKVSNPDEILTVKEAALVLKKKETTIRKWCRDGLINCTVKGRSYEIRRSALDKPLNNA